MAIRLLQFGDIHFPDILREKLADVKESGFGSDFIDDVSPAVLQCVTRAAKKILNSTPDLRGILISGDLTSWGDQESYRRCVDYLNQAFSLSSMPAGSIHVVPGNHDVDRNVARDAPQDNHTQKFNMLTSAWESHNLDILPIHSIRKSEIVHAGQSVTLLSLNSCLGCGEKWFLPKQIRDGLHKLLNKQLDSKSEAQLELAWKQLDTPAFVEDHIQTLIETIEELPDETLPVVLAHHNLLPQPLLRIAMYSETINSGLVRSRLMNCKRPIVYCHGHIHDDVTEVLQLPDSTEGQLFSISSPQFKHGFNVVNIDYSTKNFPIGVEVYPYRLKNDGSVPLKDDQIVASSLRCPSEWSKVSGDRIRLVLKYLDTSGYKRFPELIRAYRAAEGAHIQEKTLTSALGDAEWLGIIDIINGSESPELWHIKKIVP